MKRDNWLKRKGRQMYRTFFTSTFLPINFNREPGVKTLAQLLPCIEQYAKVNGLVLEFQHKGMPIRFTLNGQPYIVIRGSGRGGPVYGATRDFGDFDT